MNLEEVKKRKDVIDSVKSDDETAHNYDVELLVDFTRHVAETGSPEISEMAKEILRGTNWIFGTK